MQYLTNGHNHDYIDKKYYMLKQFGESCVLMLQEHIINDIIMSYWPVLDSSHPIQV